MKINNYRMLSALLAISMLATPTASAFASTKGDNNPESTADSDSLNISKKIDLDELAETNKNEKIRVVVEVKDESILEQVQKEGKDIQDLSKSDLENRKEDLEEKQNKVKKEIDKKNIEMNDSKEGEEDAGDSFTTVINGFSTYVKAGDLEKVKKIKNVKEVYPVNEFNAPPSVPMMTSSNDMIGSPTAWEAGYKGEGMVVAVIDSGYDVNHKDFKITDPSKAKLNEEKVQAIIREHNLPGRYYNEKFPYAYNYYDRTHNIKSSVSNHGQHVAGTIAANGDVENGGIKGVAPEAQILGMKVFSDDPLYATTFSDIYAKAIDDAILLGADAINMSLGAPAGSYVYGGVEEVAIKKAQDAGVLVSIAAGNEHNTMTGAANFAKYLAHSYPLPLESTKDTGVLGSPSLYDDTLSVASANNTNVHYYALKYTLNGEDKQSSLNYADGSPKPWEQGLSTVNGADIAYIDANNKGEGSSAPGDKASFDNHPEVAGKVVFVERGNTFADTIVNAQNAGAKAVVVYNNERADSEVLINMAGGELAKIPFAIVGRNAGLEVVNNLDKVSISFPEEMLEFEDATGGQISSFSSWGTTPNLQIKPEITAPGGNIYSTDNDDGYVNMSGTSMATPHMSGATALVYQRIRNDKDVFGDVKGSDISNLAKALMMNTAKPMINPNGNLYLVRQQGSGMMSLEDALKTEVYILNKKDNTPKVELGSFTEDEITMEFTIYNKSSSPKSYSISADALTDAVESDEEGNSYLIEESLPLEEAKFDSPRRVVVPANSSKTVKVTLDISKSIKLEDLKEESFVEGFVNFKSLDGDSDLSLPFLGYYGDFEAGHVLDEPATNLLDDDKANDPIFTQTGLVTFDFLANTYDPLTYNPVYINSNNLGMHENFVFRTSVLRNYDHIDFTIEDKNGKVLRNLGRSEDGRKINRMDQGVSPITMFDESIWDGKVDGKPIENGKSVYYTVKAYFKKNSNPQVIRYEVKSDTKEVEIAEEATYNPEKNTVRFRAKDDVSGVYEIIIASADQYDEIFTGNFSIPYIDIYGEDQLSKVRVDGDRFDGVYEINLGDKFKYDSKLKIGIYDKAINEKELEVEKQALEKILAPTVDGGKILKDTNITGNANRVDADVVLEKEVDGKREEIARVKSNADGKFTFEIKDLTLADGDILYLYTIKDEVKSSESKFVVGENKPAPEEPAKEEIIEPSVDGGYIFKDTDITGDAYRKAADVVLEKEVDGNREELARVKSNDNGKFTFAIKELTLEDGDILYLYSIKDGVKSPKSKFEVGNDPNIMGFGDLQIVLEKPDLLAGYSTNKIEFKGTVYGWDNIDEIKYGNTNIDFEVKEHEHVINPLKGEEMYYGKAYTFDQIIKLEDGFYDTPIMVIDKKNDREKGISRRFWVDATAPEFTIDTPDNMYSIKDKYGKDITVLTPGDSVKLELNFRDNNPIVDITKDGYKLQSYDASSYTGYDEKGTQGSINDIITIPEGTKEITKTYTVTDLAGNSSSIKVKVVRSELNIGESGEEESVSPRIIAYDKYVFINEKVDLLDGVKAYTKENKEISDRVKADPESIDTSRPGTHTIKYSVIDDENKSAKKEVKVFVVDRENNTLNFTELNENLNKAQEDEYSEENLTTKSYKNLKKAIEAAKYLLKIDSKGISQGDIDDVNEELEKAIENAVSVEKLKDDLTFAKDIVEYNSDSYKKESIDKLKEAIAKAEKLLEEGDATQDMIDQADDALNKAIDRLEEFDKESHEKLADKQELEKIIADYEEKLANGYFDGYTDESVENLKDKINKAKEALNNPNLSQKESQDLIQELFEAFVGLEKAKEEVEVIVDKTKLEELYKQLSILDLEGYSEDSANKLKEKLEVAKAILENEDKSQEDVDKAYEELREAYDTLEKVEEKETVDTTNLLKVYNSIVDDINSGKLNLDDYTEESVKEFNKALEEADKALNSEDISQEEIDQILSKLIEAKTNLEEKEVIVVDKTILEEVYGQLINKDLEGYSEELVNEFKNALAKAKEVIDNNEASQEEANEAVEALLIANDKVNAAERKEDTITVNKQTLKIAIDFASKFLEDDSYTEESLEALKASISEGKALLEKEDASQEEVDKAVDKIRASVDNLVKKPVLDKTLLQDILKKAKEELKNLDDTQKEALEKLIKEAEDLLANEKTSQDQINKSFENIRNALDKNEKEKSITKLRDLINEANKTIAENQESQEDIDDLEAKIKKAIDILTNNDANLAQISKASEDLEEALEDFVSKLKDGKTETNTPSKDNISNIQRPIIDPNKVNNHRNDSLIGSVGSVDPGHFIDSKPSKENSKEVKERLEELQKAVYDNRVTAAAARYLLENTPNTVKSIEKDLKQLIKESNDLIERAETLLKSYGADTNYQFFKGNDKLGKKDLRTINQAIFNNKVMLDASKLLIEMVPNTIKDVRDELESLAKNSEEIIDKILSYSK